jgi:hypothetical protein
MDIMSSIVDGLSSAPRHDSPNLLAARRGAALWSDMRPLGRVVAIAVLAFGYSLVVASGAPGHNALIYLLQQLLLPLFVFWWVEHDARTTRYWPAYHYGFWLWYAWPITVPHYVLHTRGRRGWALSLLLVAALLSPWFGSALGHALRTLVDGSGS